MTYESGDRVTCSYAGTEYTGTFITHRDGMAVIKLDSGYNIGVSPHSISLLSQEPKQEPVVSPITQDENLPEISIISTGGTIASKIDYRTGAVTSQFSADDIMRALPGLSSIARCRSHVLATILSENMNPSIWQELARKIYSEINNGAEGIIVTHGTDTMAFSAAAISFMVKTPVPIVFVGSQRSADRPSSDNLMNGLCSAAVATSDLGEVAVVMHGTSNDDFCQIYRGTRVRKMHTSRRDAFKSPGFPSLGSVSYPDLSVKLTPYATRRGSVEEPELFDNMEEKVGLLTFHPGMNPEIIRAYDGYKGLVIAGTGLGHTSSECIEAIKYLNEEGTVVVMTSQCLHGRVCDRVYDTGRDLLDSGVIEGEDMLPETAFVKLAWALGQTTLPDEIEYIMKENIAGELWRCSPHGA
jgi:glutamyl-tRNA(Gln) amidotransferase subunit D